jgi:hypothetical protein
MVASQDAGISNCATKATVNTTVAARSMRIVCDEMTTAVAFTGLDAADLN